MAGYIGTKAVNLSTTGADINGNANVDGTLDVTGATTVTGAFTSLGIDDNAAATAITIDASGNVGIGGASTLTGGKNIEVRDASVARLGFTNTSAGGSQWAWFSGTVGQAALYDYDNSRQAMTIDSSGNVGIGTTAAAGYKLDVNGAFTVGGNFNSGADTNGGGVNIGFDTSTGGSISALDPAVSWYPLNIAGSNVTFGTFGTENMRLDGNGNLLVGTTTSLAGLGGRVDINSGGGRGLVQNISSGVNRFQEYLFNGGTVGFISTNGSTTTYSTTSDYRLKENVTPVQGAGDIVKAMRPVTYTYRSDGSWMDGFLAHELQELHPRAVTGSKDAMRDEEYEVTPAVEATYGDEGVELTPAVPAVMGTRSVPDYQGVDYSKLTPILTAALKEALNKIDALEAQNAAFEARLTALEATP